METAHGRCIQDAKVRELCDRSGRLDERVKALERQSDEIFMGESSMKARLIEAECGIEAIQETIRRSSASLKWFLGIMIAAQIAAFGGLAVYCSHLVQPAHAAQLDAADPGHRLPGYVFASGEPTEEESQRW